MNSSSKNNNDNSNEEVTYYNTSIFLEHFKQLAELLMNVMNMYSTPTLYIDSNRYWEFSTK